MRKAASEGDSMVGAGVPPANTALYARPTLRQRFWSRLGFCHRFDPDLFDWRNREPKEGDWFVPSALNTDVTITVSWLDRLRILVSGRCKISVYTRTDVLVNKAESRSKFAVLPPQ